MYTREAPPLALSGNWSSHHASQSRRFKQSPKGLRKEPQTLSAQPKGNLWGSFLVFGSRELRFETKACAKLGNPGLGMLKAGTVQGLPDRCRGHASLTP